MIAIALVCALGSVVACVAMMLQVTEMERRLAQNTSTLHFWQQQVSTRISTAERDGQEQINDVHVGVLELDKEFKTFVGKTNLKLQILEKLVSTRGKKAKATP